MGDGFNIDVRSLRTMEDLSSYINIDPFLFQRAISNDEDLYKKHLIPKKGKRNKGKYREVWEVMNPTLARSYVDLYKNLDNFLRQIDIGYPHQNSYGFIKGKNIFHNAQPHCGGPLFIRADIEEFFPSITIKKLLQVFLQLGIDEKICWYLAKFLTIQDTLAQGLNTSPMIANLVCLSLDRNLTLLAEKHQCRYSRYADDITFSGDTLPEKISIEKILNSEGFRLSEKKYRVTKLGQACYVTGLSVSDPERPHVPKEMKRRLRQEMYYSYKYGIISHFQRINEKSVEDGIHRIDGMIRYMLGIEGYIPRISRIWGSAVWVHSKTIYKLLKELKNKIGKDYKDFHIKTSD